MGCRTLNDERRPRPSPEYFGVMIGQDPRTDRLSEPHGTCSARYSAERRDRAPLIETEDFRDEAARRFWDDYSPPHFGFKPGPNDTYHWNSETFCLAAAARYHDYFSNMHHPTPTRPTPNGRATPRFTGRTRTPTAARTAARSAASAARWMRCACPSRLITSIA